MLPFSGCKRLTNPFFLFLFNWSKFLYQFNEVIWMLVLFALLIHGSFENLTPIGQLQHSRFICITVCCYGPHVINFSLNRALHWLLYFFFFTMPCAFVLGRVLSPPLSHLWLLVHMCLDDSDLFSAWLSVHVHPVFFCVQGKVLRPVLSTSVCLAVCFSSFIIPVFDCVSVFFPI